MVIQERPKTASDMETNSPTKAPSCWSVVLGTNSLVTSPGHVKQMANGQLVNQLARVSNVYHSYIETSNHGSYDYIMQS